MATKVKKQNEKIINLDLWIKGKATKNDWDRYESVLVTFGNFIFQNKIGGWGGRESAMGKTTDGLVRTNYWFVLENGTDKAVKELKRIIKNFRLGAVTKMQVGKPNESKVDYKTKLEKQKSFVWEYHRK